MKKLQIQSYTVIVDDDVELDDRWVVRKIKQRLYVSSGKLFLHRVIMNAQAGELIDHLNDNPLDNRRSNLRRCTHGQNRQRSRTKPQGSSSYVGVSVHGNKFNAKIWFNNKCYYIGTYETEIAASKAYDQKAIELFGEYAKINHV